MNHPQQPYQQPPVPPRQPHVPQQHYQRVPVPPPGYPAPPGKSNTLKIILIVLAGIVVLCGIGGVLNSTGDKAAENGSPGDTPAAAPDPGDAPAAAPEPGIVPDAGHPAPGLNVPVRDGKFEFIVTDVRSGITEVGDNPFTRKQAQGAFTIVSLSVRNISDVPDSFAPGSQDLYDTENRKFDNDSMAAMNLQAETSLYARINPGNSITAQLVYDLPAGSVPDHIVLHDSMFSGGVKVSLR
ncbi:DUF4352 domain-containing protein [Nocardia sp. CC227C]|uniref:DUF4352 domain-containing protein n=1 Tax=Nocardia sp. CC227C TaxID=3044562 RepID=UPI00278BB9BA|nr:DUF4352 domain-containing protein [Nocardia sp. CC227C]